MNNGFTKIPNSILDMPWANNPIAVYIYTWLSIHADEEGKVTTSIRLLAKHTKLSLQQVRTAIGKLLSTQVVTQDVTQGSTQVTTIITISYLAGCGLTKNKGNTSANTSTNTSCNTPRAYKNDNIISCLKQDDIKTIPPLSPKGETKYDWSEVPEDVKPIVNEWLKYKKEKKQTYKPAGFKAFVKMLSELSGGDATKARLIIEQSMANNYSGIFELKRNNNGTTQTNQGPGQGSDHPSDGELREQSIRIMQRRKAERLARQAAVRDGGLFPDEGNP